MRYWLCGCGWENSISLIHCTHCARTMSDGQGTLIEDADQPCGHPASSIRGNVTQYCVECALLAEIRELKERVAGLSKEQ